MNPANLLCSAIANKHTSGAAGVYLVVKYGAKIATTWWPTHQAQFDATADAIDGFAVAYGLFAAGDAAKSATKADLSGVANAAANAINTGDTTLLTKADVANPPKQP